MIESPRESRMRLFLSGKSRFFCFWPPILRRELLSERMFGSPSVFQKIRQPFIDFQATFITKPFRFRAIHALVLIVFF